MHQMAFHLPVFRGNALGPASYRNLARIELILGEGCDASVTRIEGGLIDPWIKFSVVPEAVNRAQELLIAYLITVLGEDTAISRLVRNVNLELSCLSCQYAKQQEDGMLEHVLLC
jgi:hypothetical protein